MTYPDPTPTRGLPARLALLAVALVLTLGPLTGCDATTPDENAPAPMLTAPAHSEPEAEIVIVEEDGTLRTFVEGEAGVEVAAPGGNGVAVVVTGSATFSSTSVPQLRINARQTEAGAVSGGGRVTLRSALTGLDHTTDFTASCIKPIHGWGRTNYGVTVELAEPFRPYGSLAYTHVALSITEDGHIDALVMNTRPFCGGSIALHPPQNRLTGNMQAILTGP